MSNKPNMFEALGQLMTGAGKVANDVGKAKRILDYWSPDNSENRKEIEKEIHKIRIKEETIIDNYKKMWIAMIVTTIILQIFFNKIVILCGVQGILMEFFLVTGIAVVLNVIIGIIIFIMS